MRMKMKAYSLLLLLFIVTIGLIGCSNDSDSENGNEKQDDESTGEETEAETSGGTLNLSIGQQPNTIDPLVTTATATAYAAKPIFETLVTVNENYEVVPMLAESFEESEDGKSIIFKLRKGVKFHNGNEMTADDVLASMNRWLEMSQQASASIPGAKWEKIDEETVELQLEKPSSIALYTVAEQNQVAAIMPKEIAESATEAGAEEYIGTGPFEFVEWKTDQYIHYKKFDDYQSRTEPASGLAGEKKALVDEIYWNFVPDESTRISGLISGEYDISIGVAHDNVKQIEENEGIQPEIWTYGKELLIFNKQQGVFADKNMRQAVNAALDFEGVLRASFGDEQFYELEHGLFTPEIVNWYSDAGKEMYNQQDPELTQSLLEEAGYDGEEIVILTSREYPHYYNAAVAVQQQLEKVGVNAKLDVFDWATLLDRRSDPELWDIFFTGWDTQVIPHGYNFLDSKAEYPGWTNSPELDQYLEDISNATSQEEATAIAEQLQEEFWDYLPLIILGLFKNTDGYSEKVQGFQNFIGPVLWNVSVEE